MSDDSSNPWWLENTPEIHYTIDIDKRTFSVSEAELDNAFHEALDFWRAEFSRTSIISDEVKVIQIASQKFVAARGAQNDEQVDLRILAGRATLDAAGRSHLASFPIAPSAMLIRTSYDRANMRGRGFLYLAPDMMFPSNNRREKPWGIRGVLRRILVHKMGHIFGVPHRPDTVMDARLPNSIFPTPPRHVPVPIVSYTSPWSQFRPEQSRWINLFLSESIIDDNNPRNSSSEILLTREGSSRYSIATRQNDFSTWTSIGHIDSFESLDHHHTEYPVAVFLPHEQRIFEHTGRGPHYVTGNLSLDRRIVAACFTPIRGESKRLTIIETPEEILMLGDLVRSNGFPASIPVVRRTRHMLE